MTERLIGVVPAAGMGRRLFPYPHAKELFPVGYQEIEVNGRREKRPKVISQYLIESIIAAQVEDIFFIIGPGKYDIMSYYGNGQAYGANFAYLLQEELLGMPYAIDLIWPWLRGTETVVMGMPDTVVEPRDSFRQLISAHTDARADLTLGLFRTHNPSKFGMIDIDADHNVIAHIDKPAHTNFPWMWGITCWGPAFTELLHTTLQSVRPSGGSEIILGNLFDRALEMGLRVKGLPFANGHYLDIGTYDDLKLALERYT